MSRARHKRADGGKLSSKPEWEAGGNSNAAKEAEEKKRGGSVKAEGKEAKKRMDHKERARGGGVNEKMHEGIGSFARGGHVGSPTEMHEVKHHSMKHVRRARGGRIGADKAPLTTAARVKHVTKGETSEEGVNSDAHSMKTIEG
jgi:hypothetical protein